MMKSIALLVTIILIHTAFYSQNKNDDYKKMVDSAIIMQTINQNKTTYREGIYLIDAKDQAYIFTSDADRKKFSYISIYDRKNRKLLKKGINVWKVLPMLSNNKLIISIIDFVVTYKNNNYNFANRGGAKVIFEYSCDNEKWMLRETKWTGI